LIRVARRAGTYAAVSPAIASTAATDTSATGSAGVTSCRSPVSPRPSQIVATSYAVLCAADQAHKARSLLQPIGGVVSGWPEPAVPVVPAQSAPPATPPGSAAAPPSGTGEPPA